MYVIKVLKMSNSLFINKYIFCYIKSMQYLFIVFFFFQECQIRTVCQAVLFAKFLKIVIR